MLRLLVILLVLANALFFAWSLGWLDALVGIPARGDRDPQRLERQVDPQRVTLLGAGAVASAAVEAAPVAAGDGPAPAASAAAAASAASAATVPASAPAPAASTASAAASAPMLAACLEAGPYDASALSAAEAALRGALPDGRWTRQPVAASGEWMIYMGPYPDDGWIERKQAELARIRGGIAHQVVEPTGELGRGLSLGRFDSQAAAEQRLQQYRARGIRTARVVRSGDGAPRTLLRIDRSRPGADGAPGAIRWPAGTRLQRLRRRRAEAAQRLTHRDGRSVARRGAGWREAVRRHRTAPAPTASRARRRHAERRRRRGGRHRGRCRHRPPAANRTAAPASSMPAPQVGVVQ